MYEYSKDFRFYQDDGTTPTGWGCGRHDQTLLSALAYTRNLKVFKQDYTQQTPMMLPINGGEVPFYITWDKPHVCQKTHIYSCRGDLSQANMFRECIKYK